ncbi:amidohydrolase family protein [Natronoarchaeum rubrum]|uniref:amidohydrolase family protein n=1 Tax=Natronoarchaeum rubrum TaxID=755311 RepID=UPI002112798E|nr:amidohydrolase family protein [Natronoarchaeum rubrum]
MENTETDVHCGCSYHSDRRRRDDGQDDASRRVDVSLRDLGSHTDLGTRPGVSRRSFLASTGAAAGIATLAGCQGASTDDSGPSAGDETTDDGPTELSGRIVTGEAMSVVEGTVVVEDGTISEIREEGVDSNDIVVPAFVNTHTHITDSIAKEAGRGYTWSELFIDPNVKGRVNSNATAEERRTGMRRTMEFMRATGTGTFVDFKELGLDGVDNLESVDEETAVDALTLLTGEGLPDDVDLETEIEQADGYNAYYPYTERDERAREICRETDKVFALHSGEPGPDDIDASLALEPDYTSHMVHTREKDYSVLADNDIGVACLPRSNLVILDELPPLERLAEATTVALGTDNVMLNNATMFREMEFTSKLFDVTPREVLRMATINGAKLIGRDDEIGTIEEGKRAKLTVVDGDGELRELVDDEIVGGVVRRGSAREVQNVVLD